MILFFILKLQPPQPLLLLQQSIPILKKRILKMPITNITKIGHSTPLGINIHSNIQIILGIHRMEKRARQITANILMVMEVKTKNQTMRGMNLNL